MKKKKILGIIPKRSAVTTYRVIRPFTKVGGKVRFSLLRKNERIKTELLAERLKKQGDIWVIKYIEHLQTANLIVWMRNKVNSTLVIDIDDNVWEIPYGNITIHGKEAMEAHINRGFWTLELIKAADAVTVSTEPLKDKLKSFNSKIEVIPNLIDPKDWKYKPKPHDTVRIGWIYSHTHIPDIKEVKEALNNIKEKYGDRIEIIIFGSDLQVFSFKPEHHWGVKFAEYPKKLTELSFDISICPLEDNEFNKCKSNIKWMESVMSGAAVIASDVYPYSTSIEDGVTGLIAKDKKDWERCLTTLIEDKELRKELVENARKVVIDKYNIEKDTTIKTFYDSL